MQCVSYNFICGYLLFSRLLLNLSQSANGNVEDMETEHLLNDRRGSVTSHNQQWPFHQMTPNDGDNVMFAPKTP